MAWIATVPEEAAEGLLKREYDEAVQRAGRVFEVVKISSLNAEVLNRWIELYKAILLGPSPLSRLERELVATVVSQVNSCHY